MIHTHLSRGSKEADTSCIVRPFQFFSPRGCNSRVTSVKFHPTKICSSLKGGNRDGYFWYEARRDARHLRPGLSPLICKKKTMGRFNVGIKTKTENLAGGRAFKMGTKEELLHAVLTTFLTNKFYETGDDRLSRIQALIAGVPADFVAKLAVVSRKEFHLRSVFHALVGELSKIHRGDDLVRKVIEKGVERPDDLTEIAGYLEGKLSKQVKRGMRRAILKFSPYSIAKYRMEGKKIKLVDIFNLVHPKPQFASEEQKVAWKALMEGKLISTDTWESRLSSGEDKRKVWRDMVLEKKIGYMALLRNLRNIESQADEETKKAAASMISDRGQVKKSKQLPFRFYKAYSNVSELLFTNAIAQAMEYSVDNVPDIDGLTLIGVDTSGSMSGDPIEKASIIASALIKKSNCDVMLYDTKIQSVNFNSIDSVIGNSWKIQKLAQGGGTKTSLVFYYAHQTGKKYKRIIILSDNESWDEYSVQSVYNEYRKENDCYVYAIDIEGYGTTDVKGKMVEHIGGFSERIFDFILAKEKGTQTLLDYVEKYEI